MRHLAEQTLMTCGTRRRVSVGVLITGTQSTDGIFPSLCVLRKRRCFLSVIFKHASFYDIGAATRENNGLLLLLLLCEISLGFVLPFKFRVLICANAS